MEVDEPAIITDKLSEAERVLCCCLAALPSILTLFWGGSRRPRFLQGADGVEDVDEIWDVVELCLLGVRGLTAVNSGRFCCRSRVIGIGIFDGAIEGLLCMCV